MNEEVKLLLKLKKKVGAGGGSGPVGDRGVEGWGWSRGRGWVGSNDGGRGDVGYGGVNQE